MCRVLYLPMYGIHARVSRMKPLFSRKNRLFKFCQRALRHTRVLLEVHSLESKIELFGPSHRRHIWRKANTTYNEKNFSTTVKHCGGKVKVWGCFSASGCASVSPYIRVLPPCSQRTSVVARLHSSYQVQH